MPVVLCRVYARSRLVLGLLAAVTALGVLFAFTQSASAARGASGSNKSAARGASGSNKSAARGASGSNNDNGVTTIGRGSDTTYNVDLVLGSLYTFSPTAGDGVRTENRNGDTVLNAPPQGSSVGIQQLSQGFPTTGFARSSRAPRYTSSGTTPADRRGLEFAAYARDAIVPVTFGDDPASASAGVENLTRDQLRGIFVTCTITNWKQLGGKDAPIAVYAIQPGSGTRATFDSFLGGDSSRCAPPGNIIFENNPSPILSSQIPQTASRAIFYFSFGRLKQTIADERINVLSVNGVEPSTATIADRSYPFVRDLYHVYFRRNANARDANANAAAKRFSNWVCKANDRHGNDPITGMNYGEEIDQTIRSLGFAPLDACTYLRT